MKYVLLDVGANWGTDSLVVTRDNPHYLTYAFEPTQELQTHLMEASAAFSARYHVMGFALSDFDGEADFHIASHADWGVSSLLEFAPNIQETWNGRTDLYVDRVETVPVMRFDTWFKSQSPDFDRIDFFHCDTQGSDLKVLTGMGDCFEMIVEGVIECPASIDVRLYTGQHTLEQAQDFLSDRGYEVFRREPQQNEINLFFRRKA
jgi:FkbM family methyltransferase